MEWAREVVLEIGTLSRQVVSAATDYARRKGAKKVQPCHFRLQRELRTISGATEHIVGILDESSPAGGPELDGRIVSWLSSEEPQTCFETLDAIKKLLEEDLSLQLTGGEHGVSSSRDKITEAANLFNSRKDSFPFLLSTDIANRGNNAEQLSAPRHLESHIVQEQNLENCVPVSVRTERNDMTTHVRPDDANQSQDMVPPTQKLDQVIKWLNALTCADTQQVNLSLHLPNTCKWLPKTPEYKAWWEGDSSFLWLCGKPGAGKSVLASSVIDSLETTRRTGEAVAYFYFDFRNERSASAAEALRSILSQLLSKSHFGTDPSGLLDELVKTMESGSLAALTSLKKLSRFVSKVAKRFSSKPWIVIDAPDECKDIENLLDGLIRLNNGNVRLFVTSRPLQIIEDSFSSLPFISMDRMAAELSADIKLYVQRQLNTRHRLRALDIKVKSDIRLKLCTNADGMFRWVKGQLDNLERCKTRTELMGALRKLEVEPTGFHSTLRRKL